MSNVRFEPGKHGANAIATGLWSQEETEEAIATNIGEITLNNALGWTAGNLGFLRSFPQLKYLRILAYSRIDLTDIHSLKQLQGLQLTTGGDAEVDFLAFPNLKFCGLGWQPGVDSIFNRSGLEHLIIHGYPSEDPAHLIQLTSLQNLRLLGAKFRHIDWVSNLKELRNLELTNMWRVRSLEGIQDANYLKELRLDGFRNLEGIAPLGKVPHLRSLSLHSVGPVPTIRPLANLLSLECFFMGGTTIIEDGDMSVLLEIPSLKQTVFPKKKHYTHGPKDFPQRLHGRRVFCPDGTWEVVM